MNNQRWEQLPRYFEDKAVIEWPNTQEVFTAHGFMKANSAYPGKWSTVPQRIEAAGDTFISVTKVSLTDGGASLYAISFFEFEEGLITRLTEYWSENGEAPEWRKALGINMAK